MPEWEAIDWVFEDAWLAFGSPTVDRKQVRGLIAEGNGAISPIADANAPIALGVLNGSVIGLPFVAAYTEADADVPLEVQRNTAHDIVRARLCWTDDVDELETNGGGCWVAAGNLEVSADGCQIWSPIVQSDNEGGTLFRPAPGTYDVEVFDADGDLLGLRITKAAI